MKTAKKYAEIKQNTDKHTNITVLTATFQFSWVRCCVTLSFLHIIPDIQSTVTENTDKTEILRQLLVFKNSPFTRVSRVWPGSVMVRAFDSQPFRF